MHNNININVSGPVQPSSQYKTVVLKGNHSFASQVTEPNMKYVIKHDFDLGNESITIPEGCLIEFDGGAISNGTLVGQSTILIYNQELDTIFHTVTRQGTFVYNNTVSADEEDITEVGNLLKLKDRGTADGMGKIILRKNKTFAEQLTQENTIYVIQYDFTLGEDITIPADCILEFDGGSISGEHTLTGNNTSIKAGLVKIFNTDVTIKGSWNVPDAYPEWFGAKGDGQSPITHQHSGTDDTIPIQKCINSFQRTILCGRCYYLNSYSNEQANICLNIPEGHALEGHYVQYDQYFHYNLIIGDSIKEGNIIRLQKYSSLSNIHIEGAIYQQNNVTYGKAISTPNSFTVGLSLSNVSTLAFETHYDLVTYLTRMDHCTATMGVTGFYIHGENGRGTTLNMLSCYTTNITTNAYKIINMAYSVLTSCAADHCATTQGSFVYYIGGCNTLFLLNCSSEDSGAFLVSSGANLLTINGCRIWYNNTISMSYMFQLGCPTLLENVVINKRYTESGDSWNRAIMATTGSRVIARNVKVNDEDLANKYINDYNGGKFVEIDSYSWDKWGETRPVVTTFAPFEFFDTTLNQPIYRVSNPSAWVNAFGVRAGTPISGNYSEKPTVAYNLIPIGFRYFCTDRQTTEGATDGIEIIHKGNDVWVDALGRVVS